MVFTQVKENAQIEKYYGLKTSEDCVMEVKAWGISCLRL